MILTVTLNPSVDIRYHVDSFSLNTVNRVHDTSKTAGGKGLNVSRVLRDLSEDVAATGFLGGSLGSFIRSEIDAEGIEDYFVPIQGETRNCIAVIHKGQQTEILEQGPIIGDQDAQFLLEKLPEWVQQSEVVTVSGSLPSGLDAHYYQHIAYIAEDAGTPLLLDTKGELLRQILNSESKPYLIKPNQEELSALLGEELKTEKEMIKALSTEWFQDVPWVVVTLGAQGAMVKQGTDFYRIHVPQVQAVNPVGSGDAVIAGFATALKRKYSIRKSIQFGCAMGVLNAMETKTGHIDPTKVDVFVDRVLVERIV